MCALVLLVEWLVRLATWVALAPQAAHVFIVAGIAALGRLATPGLHAKGVSCL